MSAETKLIEKIAQERFEWQQKYFALKTQHDALLTAAKVGKDALVLHCGKKNRQGEAFKLLSEIIYTIEHNKPVKP